ncbi:hypothetical protein ACYT69_11710, partial [Streptococcus pyogenes]
MNGKIALRVVAGLVLLAVIAAIGFFAFQAGVAQGSPITIMQGSTAAGFGRNPKRGRGRRCLFPYR